MSRKKGVSNYASNFEVLKDAPLDSRCLVQSREDLYKEETWQNTSDSNKYVYIGMLVVSEDSPGKIFQLIDLDYTQETSWKIISSEVDLIYPSFIHEGNKLYIQNCSEETANKFTRQGNKLQFEII